MKRRKTAPAGRSGAAAGAKRASPELSAAILAMAAASRRRPGPTLARVRAALLRQGVTWSREGELLFPQDRTALVIEVDELIEAHGARADARRLIARARRGKSVA